MADRVHPLNSPPLSAQHQTLSSHHPAAVAVAPNPTSPPAGTYVIKIPKDQVYRVPPPENALKYNQYARRNNRRCHCCYWFFGILFILILLLAIAAGVFYLVFRPKALDYSIESIAIRGLNLTSPSSAISMSPEFNVTVRANNPNAKIGIRYLKESSAEIFFKDVMLCNGVLPAFYQPSKNVTVFETALKGNVIEVKSSDRTALMEAQTKLEVPLTIKLRAPVKVKVGAVETGKITVTVDCDVTVDKLTAQAKIVSRHCNYGVDIIWVVKI